MNERMNQLQTEAARYAKEKYPSDIVKWSLCMSEKFAELIVRECIGVVEGGRFLHDQAPTALFAKECSGAIKRHFGVDE
jgi:hypothetical protein